MKDLNAKPAIPYPKHGKSFECYFDLGERRTLREVARVLYQELKPTHFRKNKEYKTSEEAFYVRIRRWAKQEKWALWIEIKEAEQRRLKQEGIKRKSEFVERLKFYQGIVRDGLDFFSYKLALAMQLKTAAENGDDEKVKELKKKIDIVGEIKLDNFGEARKMLEMLQTLNEEIQKAPKKKD